VIYAVAAHQANAVGVLVGQHPPAVHLFLVDPAGAVEGLGDERGSHRQVVRDHGPFYPRVPVYPRVPAPADVSYYEQLQNFDVDTIKLMFGEWPRLPIVTREAGALAAPRAAESQPRKV
jgi:hypothetical protein